MYKRGRQLDDIIYNVNNNNEEDRTFADKTVCCPCCSSLFPPFYYYTFYSHHIMQQTITPFLTLFAEASYWQRDSRKEKDVRIDSHEEMNFRGNPHLHHLIRDPTPTHMQSLLSIFYIFYSHETVLKSNWEDLDILCCAQTLLLFQNLSRIGGNQPLDGNCPESNKIEQCKVEVDS